jgi:hypothetical protein
MREFRLESEPRFSGMKPPGAKKFRLTLDFAAGQHPLADASPRR